MKNADVELGVGAWGRIPVSLPLNMSADVPYL